MNIIGIGTDIADIPRLKKILSKKSGKHCIDNTFTEKEIAYAKNNLSKLATAFAAKEALYKAFGTGWIKGKDVEVIRNRKGAPKIKLHGEIEKIAKKRKVREIFLTLSSTECCAIAVVLLTS